MIRPINIKLNAAHPELPLLEAVTYTGSPSTVLIRGVPPNCGRWAITAVFVAASFPDGSTTTRAAVESAEGVWVATLPATATSGRTANGIRVMADGIDENGEAVTGYILGVADFAVASLDVTPAPEPGETSYQMLYFDEVPSVLRKGDVAKIDGVLKFYNGTAWEPFAAPVTLDDTVTPASANGVKSSGIWSALWGALSALPTGFTSLYDWCVSQLAGKLSTSGGTVTGNISMPTGQLDAGDVQTHSYFEFNKPNESQKYLDSPENSGKALTNADIQDSSSALGAALDGKQPALSAQQLANIAAVSDALAFDATHSYSAGDPVVYNGTLYTFTAAHTGAWTGGDVSAVNALALIQALQSGKLDSDGLTNSNGGYLSAAGLKTNSDVQFSSATLNSPMNSGAALTDSDISDPASPLGAAFAGKADVSAIPYTLGTPIVINTASSETVEGETVYYGAATLANRTANIVQVTAATALDELRITFPAATSGKVRDFGLRVEIGTGSAALAAPALVPIAPTGETIKIENADGTIPALADGTATAKGVTLLYFSETAPGVFVVKGEQVEEVA